MSIFQKTIPANSTMETKMADSERHGTAVKKGVLIAACAAFSLTMYAKGPENPVYEMFGDDIIFSLNFDTGTLNADMSSGAPEPKQIVTPAEFTDNGLFGKALLSGCIKYFGEKNLDLAKPGTFITWVRPDDWPAAKPADNMEPGFSCFDGLGRNPEYGFELIVGKMGGQPWGHGHFNTYVQYSGKIPHVNCLNYDRARAAEWEKKEWRMLAVTWGNGNFTTSINGMPSKSASLKKQMTGKTIEFYLGVNKKKERVMQDEVVILKRALSDEEIKKLYDEVLKAKAKK